MAEEILNTTQSTQDDSGQTQTQATTTNTNVAQQTAQNEPKTQTDIEQMIQRAVDRATNKLGNENKKLRGQIDKLKSDNLSAEEIKQFELKEKEADIADREAKLKEKENRLFTIKAIKDAGLDDGGNNALDLVDFLMADDEETTLNRVKTFDALVKKFVQAEVNRTFKDHGRNPEKGKASTSGSTQNSVAATIGKNYADRNAKSNQVLKHYLGGK